MLCRRWWFLIYKQGMWWVWWIRNRCQFLRKGFCICRCASMRCEPPPISKRNCNQSPSCKELFKAMDLLEWTLHPLTKLLFLSQPNFGPYCPGVTTWQNYSFWGGSNLIQIYGWICEWWSLKNMVPWSHEAWCLISWLKKNEKTPWNKNITRWWFETFFGIFTPIWGNDQTWLIFFRWVETTNIHQLDNISVHFP